MRHPLKRIVVNGKYTYETRLQLKIGDRVRLPGSWVPGNEDGWNGTVTALRSDYNGSCKQITHYLEERKKR